MLNKLFSNVGGKIKIVAMVFFVIEAVSAIIAGIVFFFVALADTYHYGGAFMLAPFATVAACGAALLMAWPIYAFGQLVEDTHAMRNKEGTTQEVKDKAMREAEEKARREAEERARREAEEKAKAENNSPAYASVQKDVWYCEKCNTKNMNVRKACWNCGNPKIELLDNDFIDIACPNCGKTLSFLKGDINGVCIECGAEFDIE